MTPKRALSSEAKAAQRDARESDWDLKEEAMYVFKLADKNGSGDLDETEVEAVRAASTVLILFRVVILTRSPSPSPSPNPSPNPNPNPNPAQVRSSSAVLRMQLTEIDTDGNGVIDEGEWLVYIKAQSVVNSAATKKLLRAFAKQCGAELDFDAMKRAEVTLPSSTISLPGSRTISPPHPLPRACP